MKINCNKIVIFFIVLFILYLIYTQYLDESESKDPVLYHVINKVRPIFNQNKYYDANLLIDVFRIFRMSAYFKVKGWFKFLPLHFIMSNNTPTFDAFGVALKAMKGHQMK